MLKTGTMFLPWHANSFLTVCQFILPLLFSFSSSNPLFSYLPNTIPSTCAISYVSWLRWEKKDLRNRYHLDPNIYPSPYGSRLVMAIVRYQDHHQHQAAGEIARYPDTWYREKLREFQTCIEWYRKPPEELQQLQLEQWRVGHAQLQQYAYQQQQYAGSAGHCQHQSQYEYHLTQSPSMLPSSSSGHYLPPVHSTLYLTAPGHHSGQDGHADMP